MTEKEAAHIVLDALSSSMDWGSGFLDDEHIEAWNVLAEATEYPKRAEKHPAWDGFFRLVDR